MRISLLIGLLLICIISFGQIPSRYQGTRLSINLPEDFILDNTISGFKSVYDSSSIQVFEANVPKSYNDWINEQVSNLLLKGFDTVNSIQSEFNGFRSIRFYFTDNSSNNEKYAIFFGDDSLQIALLAEYKPSRRDEILHALLTSKYDKTIEIDAFNVIGFKPVVQNTNLKLVSKSALSLRYEERDENGDLISYLNIVRSPKAALANTKPKDVINYFANRYYPLGEQIETKKIIIDKRKAKSSIFKTNYGSYDEYNIVSILYLDEFDILIMGGVDDRNKLTMLEEMINSIKIL